MSYGYKINVVYKYGQGSQELCLNATNAGLVRMLRMLDDSADVDSYKVTACVTIPPLSTFTQLLNVDLGKEGLKKLK